jgi:hypothetical protein
MTECSPETSLFKVIDGDGPEEAGVQVCDLGKVPKGTAHTEHVSALVDQVPRAADCSVGEERSEVIPAKGGLVREVRASDPCVVAGRVLGRSGEEPSVQDCH